MVAIIECEPSVSMEVDEYASYVEDNVDVFDYDSLVESAWTLRALANNRSFLLEHYHDEVRSVLNNTTGLGLTPQSVYLVRTKSFVVRANLWLPPSSDKSQREKEQRLFSYALPHDHNFDFVTVGYFGPGYDTDLFTYDHSKVVGYTGEPVHLQYHGRERLHPGRVMVYKASDDVHTQYEPDEVSLSLNLIPVTLRTWLSPQYVFDVNESVIHGGVSDQCASRLFLLDFFRTLNDQNSIQILCDVMTDHPCPRMRGFALDVLEDIAPDESDRFRAKAAPEILAYARPNMVGAGNARQRDQA